jgi:hypothetical protein
MLSSCSPDFVLFIILREKKIKFCERKSSPIRKKSGCVLEYRKKKKQLVSTCKYNVGGEK